MTDTPDFEAGDEVELMPGFDHLYNPAPLEGRFEGVFVGCRATIKGRRNDSVGFPHVFVEWKKDDWRYQGMPDGWTFENHFRKTKPSVTEKLDNADLIIKDYIKKAEAQVKDEDRPCEHCGEVHSARQVEFIENLYDVEDKLLRSDAYFILTILPEQGDGALKVFESSLNHASLSDTAQEALEREIIRLAAELIVRRSKP
jgi:hypothetical protein